MRFICNFEHNVTGERKDVICALNADEIATVERIRRDRGEEIGWLTAAAIVLRSAYSDLNGLQWSHLSPPALVN